MADDAGEGMQSNYEILLDGSAFGGADDTWEDAVMELDSHIAEGMPDLEWRAIESNPERGPQFVQDSQRPFNVGKNRYTDVIPYDDTMVRLRPVVKRDTMEKVLGSDYFNANWIRVGGHEFIAAHAPPPATFQDWYRLLWEARVSVVVMLTGWVESRRKKADNYLPELNRAVAFGAIEVRLLSEHQPSPHYIVRELKLVPLMGKRRERIVRHYHYLSWPDQGVPDESESMLEMMQRVHEDFEPSEECRQLVHCSAGIGRTGVWCSLSSMMMTIAAAIKKDEVPELSVMRCVHEMRLCRAGMMQRYEQYLFTYKTMLNHIYKIDLSETYRDLIKSGQKVLTFNDVQETDLVKKKELVARAAAILRSASKIGVLAIPLGGFGDGEWTDRVVVLAPDALFVFSGSATSKPGSPEAQFPLADLIFEEEAAAVNHANAIHLRDKSQRNFQLAAQSETEMREWIYEVTQAIKQIAFSSAPRASSSNLAKTLAALNLVVDDEHDLALTLNIDRVIPVPLKSKGDVKLLKKTSYRVVAKLFTPPSKSRPVWQKKTKGARQLQHGESSVNTQSRPLNYQASFCAVGKVDPKRSVFASCFSPIFVAVPRYC